MCKSPYLRKVTITLVHNPDYDQDAVCRCGHPYYRHFDTYENMATVGCKYCECDEFIPATSA